MAKHSVQIQRDEHNEDLYAKNVNLVSGSTIYAVVNTGAAGDTTNKIGFATVHQGDDPWNTSPQDASGDTVDWADTGNDAVRVNVVAGGAGTTTVFQGGDWSITGNVTVDQVDVIKDIEDGAGDSIMDGANNAMNVNVVAGGAGVTTVFQGGDWGLTGNVTLSDAKTYVGLTTTTLGAGDQAIGKLTANSGVDIGDVDVTSNTAWADPKTYIGLVTITGSLAAAAGNVTLDAGSLTGIVGNVTLSDSKTFVGLVSVSGFANPLPVDATGQGDVPITLDGEVVATTFSGNVTLDPGSLTGIVGNVTLSDAKTYVGLATVTIGVGDQAIGTLAANSGVDIGDVDVTSNTAWADPNTFIGLTTTTVANTVPVSQSGAWAVTGNVTVEQGDNPWVTSNIGNVTVEQGDDPWNVAVIGNVTLSDPKTYVGLVTTTYAPPPISTYTSFSSVYSADGNATIFEPPSGERWVLKDIHIASLGESEVAIKSGVGYVIPFTGLATEGGYVSNFGEAGLAADGADQAFVVELNGAATISVMANVRFE